MKIFQWMALAAIAVMAFSSCEVEDPGPLQEISREYSLIDFDRLEMGSGFNIRVEEGNTFMVSVKGDRRNVNDLEVSKSGSTLVIGYDEPGIRRYDTYITIRMPDLKAVNFSGGSVSVIEGFEGDELQIIVSGGSVAQLDAGYRFVNATVSGGSVFKMHGLGDQLSADLSGASVLNAYDFPVGEATLYVSGASNAKVTVSDVLDVTASGASSVVFKGNPLVEKVLSGGSTVTQD